MENFRDIVEIKRVGTEAEANKLLSSGWDLLAVPIGQTEDKLPRAEYVLGRPYAEPHDVTYL